jgi:hypothetical protein
MLMSSLTVATPGEVTKATAAVGVGGATAVGGIWWLAVALSKLMTTMVRAWICWTILALEGALPGLLVLKFLIVFLLWIEWLKNLLVCLAFMDLLADFACCKVTGLDMLLMHIRWKNRGVQQFHLVMMLEIDQFSMLLTFVCLDGRGNVLSFLRYKG